jgi:hypothetical protein
MIRSSPLRSSAVVLALLVSSLGGCSCRGQGVFRPADIAAYEVGPSSPADVAGTVSQPVAWCGVWDGTAIVDPSSEGKTLLPCEFVPLAAEQRRRIFAAGLAEAFALRRDALGESIERFDVRVRAEPHVVEHWRTLYANRPVLWSGRIGKSGEHAVVDLHYPVQVLPVDDTTREGVVPMARPR